MPPRPRPLARKTSTAAIEESFARFVPIVDLARQNATPVRGYVSTITDCPYAGAVAPQAVVEVVERLLDLGCYEVSLGDTLGKAEPDQIDGLLALLLKRVPAQVLAGHFHDTSGQALDKHQAVSGGRPSHL